MSDPLGRSDPASPPGGEESAAFLRDLARTLGRHRPLFLAFAFGLPFLTAVVMLLTDNTYTAHGVLLVETPEGGLGLAGKVLGQFASVTGIPTKGSSVDIFMAILKSHRVAMAVADSLNLPEYYESNGDTPDEKTDWALQRLAKRTAFESPDLVSITVSATDTDPQMAADIVNAHLRELGRASQTLAFSRARRTRILVEETLKTTKAELDSTRDRLLNFQEKYGVFSIEKQTEGTLGLLGGLQTQLLTAQIQRETLREYTNANSSQVKALDLQIAALRDQIEEIVGTLKPEAGAARVQVPPSRGKGQVVVPLSEMPVLASQYARIFIDLRVQEAKYNVLATQLEQTKIEESQSVPTFEVLDWGTRPYRKSGPFRRLFTMAALVGGTLTGLLTAVFLEELSRRVDRRTREEFRGLVPAPIRRGAGRLGRLVGIGRARPASSKSAG
jgi:uncharacterized protein involved in exopolysaccharide biosynthesis